MGRVTIERGSRGSARRMSLEGPGCEEPTRQVGGARAAECGALRGMGARDDACPVMAAKVSCEGAAE